MDKQRQKKLDLLREIIIQGEFPSIDKVEIEKVYVDEDIHFYAPEIDCQFKIMDEKELKKDLIKFMIHMMEVDGLEFLTTFITADELMKFIDYDFVIKVVNTLGYNIRDPYLAAMVFFEKENDLFKSLIKQTIHVEKVAHLIYEKEEGYIKSTMPEHLTCRRQGLYFVLVQAKKDLAERN